MEEFVVGDNLEPDESQTPVEFANNEWLTIEQVALRCGVSTVQVRDWIASGMLTPKAFGSIERIKRSELNRIGNPDENATHEFEKEHGE